MRASVRVIAGVALAAVVLLGMAWASTAPLVLESRNDAVLRVSLGARPERIETCLEQSNEELAKVAPQMRQRVICEGTTARYRLEVLRDGVLLYSRVVRGGGLRHDRQLYVSHDLRVPPGSARFLVRLNRLDTVPAAESARAEEQGRRTEAGEGTREDAGDNARDNDPVGEIMLGRGRREVDERRRRREESVPRELSLEMATALGQNEVLLVSYDSEHRRLTSVQRRQPRQPH